MSSTSDATYSPPLPPIPSRSDGERKMKRKLFIPPISLCGDNAAMIAAAGYYEYAIGNLADSSLNASALDSIN